MALLADPADRHAVACAIARAFPRFSLKTSSKSRAKASEVTEEDESESSAAREVIVMFAGAAGDAVQWNAASNEQAALQASEVAARAVRLEERLLTPLPLFMSIVPIQHLFLFFHQSL